MYENFFGFKERPFQLVPNPAYLFLSKSHEDVLAHLTYAVSQGDGFVEITGEVGTGKTTLCRAFLGNLEEKAEAAYIFNPMLNAVQLLKTINEEFSLDASSESAKDLIDGLNLFLMEKKRQGKQVLLLIDEAQNLNRDVLEQLRLLSNLETDTSKLIQIILVGQPELRDMLDSHELRQLRQRITLSCHLRPLNLNETRDYINHRIQIAARRPGLKFTRDAFRAIYRYSRGIPRLINIVCDRALLTAYGLDHHKITGRITTAAIQEISMGKSRRTLPVWQQWPLYVAFFLCMSLLAATFHFNDNFGIPDHFRQTFLGSGEQKGSRSFPSAPKPADADETGAGNGFGPADLPMERSSMPPSSKPGEAPLAAPRRDTMEPEASAPEPVLPAPTPSVGGIYAASAPPPSSKTDGAPLTVDLRATEDPETPAAEPVPPAPAASEAKMSAAPGPPPSSETGEAPLTTGLPATMAHETPAAEPVPPVPAAPVKEMSPASAPTRASEPFPSVTTEPNAETPEQPTDSAAGPIREIGDVLNTMNRQGSRRNAFDTVINLWQAHAAAVNPALDEIDDPETFFRLAAAQQGLSLYIANQNIRLDLIRRLNLPVIFEFQSPTEGAAFLPLVQINENNSLLLKNGAESIVGSWEQLSQNGMGRAYIPWKNFRGLTGVIHANAPEASVMTLKMILKDIGYEDIFLTPAFDEPTEIAVKHVQARHGLPVDGYVGPLTKIALYNEMIPSGIPRLEGDGRFNGKETEN